MARHEHKTAEHGGDTAIDTSPEKGRELRLALLERHAGDIALEWSAALEAGDVADKLVAVIDPDDPLGRLVCEGSGLPTDSVQVFVTTRESVASAMAETNPDLAAAMSALEPGALHVLCIAGWGSTLQRPVIDAGVHDRRGLGDLS